MVVKQAKTKTLAKREKPKRLAPTRETLRELYLKSGNRCAFAGCNRTLFNAKGIFVGQVCHIQAAEPDGARFNPSQTNEERRKSSNLLLMCYDHHTETNNVAKFPVERMRRIKEEHEKKFSDVVGAIISSIIDHTTLTEAVSAKSLKRMSHVLDWGLEPEQLEETTNELSEMIDRFAKIPLSARELFEVIVRRGTKERFGAELELPVSEVKHTSGLSNAELRELFSILDRHNFTFLSKVNNFGVQMIGVSTLRSGWPVWADIKKFCEIEKISLSQIIINLDFSVLD